MKSLVSSPETRDDWSKAHLVVMELGNPSLLHEIRRFVSQDIEGATYCNVCNEEISPTELDVISDGLSIIHFNRFHQSLIDIYALKVS